MSSPAASALLSFLMVFKLLFILLQNYIWRLIVLVSATYICGLSTRREDPPICQMFPRSYEKKTVRLWCLEVPILMRSPEVRFGNTLSGGPPSPEPTLVHTNLLSRPSENPHSYTNLSPLQKKLNYLKLTTTEIDSPPASQPDKRDQAVTTPQSARKE